MPRSSADLGLFLLLCVIAMTLITPSFANGSLFVAKGTDRIKPDVMNTSSSLFKQARGGLFAVAAPRKPRGDPPGNSQQAAPGTPAPHTELSPIALQPIALRPRGISSRHVPTASQDSAHLAALDAGRGPKPPATQSLGPNASQVEQLRHLIQTAESRRDGYDAVQHGAKIKPPKRPTRMTIGEIYKWTRDTPKQPHAIGRYQFIPKTLRRLVKQLRLSERTRFTPKMQDQLADILLAEAGLTQLQAGQISRKAFMKNLAKIWAGFPLPNGRSYYHGYAGNKASMTWATYNREMARIFPS